MSTFLPAKELAELTGKKWKSQQILALQKMGIRFFINACGRPVVPMSAIDGKKEEIKKPTWQPPD